VLAEAPASAPAKVATAEAPEMTAAEAAHMAEIAAAEAAHMAEIAASEAANMAEIAAGEVAPCACEAMAVAEVVEAIAVMATVEAGVVTVAAVVRPVIATPGIVAGVAGAVRPIIGVIARIRIGGSPECASNHSGRDSGAGIVAVSVATSVSPGVMVMGHVVTGDIPVHAVRDPRMGDLLIMMSDGRRACARERRGQDKSGRAKRKSRNSKSAKCHGDIPFRLATQQRCGKRPRFILDRSALFTDKIQGDHDFACSSLPQLSPPGMAKRSLKLKFRMEGSQLEYSERAHS
jgi:hypothetical protein